MPDDPITEVLAEVRRRGATLCGCNKRPRPGFDWYQPRRRPFLRAVTFSPGYICTQPLFAPTSHGNHGLEITFAVRHVPSAIGGASWTISTGWLPGERRMRPGHGELSPMGVAIEKHSHRPMYDGQELSPTAAAPPGWACPMTDGRCYSDASYVRGDDLLIAFTEHGAEVVWSELECLTNEVGQ